MAIDNPTPGQIIQGISYNHNSSVKLPGCVVRLYDKDDGKLVESTISDDNAEYKFGLAPANWEVISYKPDDGTANIIQGSHALGEDAEVVTYFLEGALLDHDTDFIKIKPPQPTLKKHIKELGIWSEDLATKPCRFEIRNAADGAGEVIPVYLEVGDTYQYNVGNLTTDDYFYLRTHFTGTGLYNVRIDIWWV